MGLLIPVACSLTDIYLDNPFTIPGLDYTRKLIFATAMDSVLKQDDK